MLSGTLYLSRLYPIFMCYIKLGEYPYPLSHERAKVAGDLISPGPLWNAGNRNYQSKKCEGSKRIFVNYLSLFNFLFHSHELVRDGRDSIPAPSWIIRQAYPESLTLSKRKVRRRGRERPIIHDYQSGIVFLHVSFGALKFSSKQIMTKQRSINIHSHPTSKIQNR